MDNQTINLIYKALDIESEYDKIDEIMERLNKVISNSKKLLKKMETIKSDLVKNYDEINEKLGYKDRDLTKPETRRTP